MAWVTVRTDIFVQLNQNEQCEMTSSYNSQIYLKQEIYFPNKKLLKDPSSRTEIMEISRASLTS